MEEEMNNKELVRKFYTAFSEHNSDDMVACYHENVEFEDGAFGRLKGAKAKAMWKMLIEKGKGQMSLTFQDVEANDKEGSAYWIANYPYGPKKRMVENHVRAKFEFKDGLIYRHVDSFDVWKWSQMALGLPGLLLGWTPFIKNKINKEANKGLEKWMQDNKM